ncbi:unnamed protein product [Phytophthora fragariaefolia]|uniref:Unnamed protein product n=1 Tax=Phytophthora fragariaefolia TaxID=1490495 RepID=A0A9W6YE80_9STRA|nr:unnamed protein product [Phytophthora fragariaefolia]
MPRINIPTIFAASAIAAISVVPIATGFQVGSGGRVMWENNCNFDGNDYRWMTGIPDVCGDVCASDSSCTHWTWTNYNGGICWFKSGTRSAKTSKWGTNCGYVILRSSTSTSSTQVEARGQAPVAAAPTSSVASGLSSSEFGDMLNRVNAYRAQYGLQPLTIDNRLVAAGALHSRDQANRCTMTHTGSNGSGVGYRINAQGYDFDVAKENVAAGQSSVAEVMTAWWNSPGHRANLLSSDVKNVGFGKVVNNGCNNYATYWTQDFGRL